MADVSGQHHPSQSFALAEGRFLKKGMEAFHNWTQRKFALSATDKGGRLSYFQDDNPKLGRPEGEIYSLSVYKFEYNSKPIP